MVVVGCAVGMLAKCSRASAVTSMVTIHIQMSQHVSGSGITLGAGCRCIAGCISKVMGNRRCAFVIVPGGADRIGCIGGVSFKGIHTLEEPEIAFSCICAIPGRIKQEVLAIKLCDVPHVVDSLSVTEDYIGFDRSLLQHTHQQECVSLAYCLTFDQCTVGGEPVSRIGIVCHVFANIAVDGQEFFQIALTGKVKLCNHLVKLFFKALLLGIRGIVFNRIGQGVVIHTVLRVLACRCRISFNTEMRIGIELIGRCMEPIGDILLGNKCTCLIVQCQHTGLSVANMLVECVNDLTILCHVYILITGRNGGEIVHIKCIANDNRLCLIIDGLCIGDRQRCGQVNGLCLLLEYQCYERANSIAFSFVVTISKKGVFSVLRVCLDNIFGGQSTLGGCDQFQCIRIEVDRVLDAPDTGVAVKAECDIKVILIFLGLYIDVTLSTGKVGIHAFRYRCCCGQADVDGLCPGVTACNRSSIKFKLCGECDRCYTVSTHCIIQSISVNMNLIYIIPEILRISAIAAGYGHKRRTGMNKGVVTSVRKPGSILVNSFTVIGIGILTIRTGKAQVYGVCEITNGCNLSCCGGKSTGIGFAVVQIDQLVTGCGAFFSKSNLCSCNIRINLITTAEPSVGTIDTESDLRDHPGILVGRGHRGRVGLCTVRPAKGGCAAPVAVYIAKLNGNRFAGSCKGYVCSIAINVIGNAFIFAGARCQSNRNPTA